MFRIPMPRLSGEILGEATENLMNRLLKEKELQQNLPYKEAQARLANAQALRNEELANLPFAGRQIPGAPGRALGLELIKRKYGENSPQYIEAKKLYDLEIKNTKSNIAYRASLQASQPKRYATQTGKLAQEEAEVEQGYMPGSTSSGQAGIKLSPEQQDKLQGFYGLKQIKDVTDTNVRQRIIYATNMEQTLKSINPDDLTAYSGLKGGLQLSKDKAASLRGEKIPKFEKYEKALTAAEALAKQVRQFYGDSITAGVQKGLKEITNPSSWLLHPDIAKAKFIYYRDKILRPEAKNFYKAAKSAKIYEEPEKNGTKKINNDDPLGIL